MSFAFHSMQLCTPHIIIFYTGKFQSAWQGKWNFCIWCMDYCLLGEGTTKESIIIVCNELVCELTQSFCKASGKHVAVIRMTLFMLC